MTKAARLNSILNYLKENKPLCIVPTYAGKDEATKAIIISKLVPKIEKFIKDNFEISIPTFTETYWDAIGIVTEDIYHSNQLERYVDLVVDPDIDAEFE